MESDTEGGSAKGHKWVEGKLSSRVTKVDGGAYRVKNNLSGQSEQQKPCSYHLFWPKGYYHIIGDPSNLLGGLHMEVLSSLCMPERTK